jgi:two-component system sensor histidine kinase KdpD
MSDSSARPDPDALLARLKDEEVRSRRGKLKIFFGFAPGVGKTYRMLQVARDLVADQKLDVVVGLAETHRRHETAAMMLGLELMARRKIDYRGKELEEFDLDAALERKPKLLLLDELAHTNAPGSRHAKRWQDVLELLDAGIDVFSTMNVQHLESLNDIIAQITHVQVRETVPDSILDQADEIELVDIAPEELLMRLKEGKVYLPDQAQRAADHFFKRGNLLALRELALRRTAQHVDEDVLEYREAHGVKATWPAGERILVCVGPAPSSARLIRAAARMGAGLRAPWVAAYVEATALGGLGEADRARLEAHLRLAESLGGTVTHLTGGRVSEAILDYANRHNVTRIVIGKPTHSRLRDRLRGSLLDEIVRGSAEVDVHVISGDVGTERAAQGPKAKASTAVPTRPYLYAAGLVVFITALANAIQRFFPVPDIEVLYLLGVMIAAVRLGRGPSVLSAALGVAAYDFFFVPPTHTFAVHDVKYFLTFAMMFGVGLLLSELTARIKRQERDARRREESTSVLYALSRDLGGLQSLEQAASLVAGHAAEVFDAKAFVLTRNGGNELRTLSSAPRDISLDPKELGVAKWAYEHARLAGLGTDTLPGSSTLCAPLSIGSTALGVLALEPREHTSLGVEQRAFLEAYCRQAAFAFERIRLAEGARNATLRARTEEMRSTLLSAVSHDLRTPLAAITGAATTLRDDRALTAGTKTELLDSVCEEAERLERLVANLLDMTRLDSGAVVLKRDWVPLDEIVSSALARLDARLGKRDVLVHLPEDLPLISVDPVLFGQLFVNLFENAAKYTPPASTIEVRAHAEGPFLIVEVLDRGPGLPDGTESRVFEKFYRGPHTGIGGVGLGLPICRGIAEAHGGSIEAENRPDGGALFRVRVPLMDEAPSVPKDSAPEVT